MIVVGNVVLVCDVLLELVVELIMFRLGMLRCGMFWMYLVLLFGIFDILYCE